MINSKLIGILLVIILVFFGCSTFPGDKSLDNGKTQAQVSKSGSQTSIQEIEPIEDQIREMTLEEKIGQMFIVGLDGYTMDDHAKTMIEKYHIGGFILFGSNIKNSNQLLVLINSLKIANTKNKAPLFISVDQEGGRIDRMPAGLVKFPSNEAIGKVNNIDFSHKIGNMLAEEIKAFGFNLDFAPVLDVNSNPLNPVINDRSFGADAELVSKLGEATMKGIQEGGIIPVIKHFPGHGDTSVDSHKGLPVVDHDMQRLKSLEFVPFANAIDNGADAVMIAHILLKKIDPQSPASLSKAIITGLLREQLGFNGLVITDDMTMGAIIKNYDISTAVVKSVKAGSDIILVCHEYANELTAINALKKAVEDGVILESGIDESVYRILKLKYKYNLTNNVIKSINIKDINDKINKVLDLN